MSSPSPKSFRSRMGGVMRRTSSVLAMANSRPTTPTPASTPAAPSDDSRRASISKSVEGRKSTTSLTPSGATPPAPVPPPDPVPELPPVVVTAEPESVPEPAPAAVVETAPAPAVETAPASVVTEEPTPAPTPQTNGTGNGNGNNMPKAVKRLLPIAAQYQMYPSPIAESPAREAAAAAEEAENAKGNASAMDGPAAPRAEEATPAADAPPAPEPIVVPVEDAPYVPPPMLDNNGANPGAFTDEPQDMRPSEVAADPTVVAEPEPVAEPIPIPAEQPTPAPDPAHSYFDLVPRAGTEVHDVAPAPASPASGSETVVGTWTEDRERDVWAVSPYPYPAPAPEPAVEPSMPEPESEPAAVEPPSIPSPIEEREAAREARDQDQGAQATVSEPQPQLGRWVGEGGGGWVSDAMVMPDVPEMAVNEDPFADPPAMARNDSGDSGYFIPIAVVDHDRDSRAAQMDGARGYDVGGPISSIPMPLPANDQGLGPPFGSIRTMPSAENLSHSSHGHGQGHFEHTEPATDERRPLLERAASESYSYRTAQPGLTNASAEEQEQSFHDLGWIAYVLPDVSATYYVHPTLRTTTDADLRDARTLACVARALGYTGEAGTATGRSGGMELWLRYETGGGRKHVHWSNGNGSSGKGKGNAKGRGKGKGKGTWRGELAEVGLARWWVDHSKREVSAAEDVVGLEDHLDMEYRYWAFMESHPAHAALPFAARREATDVLTWAWTDRLLPPQQLPFPPPFTQNECQELLGLLRSFGDMPQNEAGIQSIVLTRIISRILMRVAHWRQHHFRPHKSLPIEPSGKNHLRHYVPSPGFMRTAADVVLACLLLGVPYLFYNRAGFHRVDAEGGGAERSMLPVLIVGACTCLLAAVLLSASVTFLSLPGLHNIARVVALVVVLLAASSMASSLVALFRFKAESQPAAATAVQLNPAAVGREGMMVISTRSVVMSLPLVLLIYAVIGFVAAVVLYSFLGVDAGAVRFEDYTRWAVLGVLGGLAGLLTMSVLLLRR